jgi:hypothetical protein
MKGKTTMNKIDMAKAFIWGAAVEVGAQNVYENKGQDRPLIWREHWNTEAARWGDYENSARAGRRLAKWYGAKRLTIVDLIWHAREHAGLMPKEGELYIGQQIHNAANKAYIDLSKNISDFHEIHLMGIVDYLQ